MTSLVLLVPQRLLINTLTLASLLSLRSIPIFPAEGGRRERKRVLLKRARKCGRRHRERGRGLLRKKEGSQSGRERKEGRKDKVHFAVGLILKMDRLNPREDDISRRLNCPAQERELEAAEDWRVS